MVSFQCLIMKINHYDHCSPFGNKMIGCEEFFQIGNHRQQTDVNGRRRKNNQMKTKYEKVISPN